MGEAPRKALAGPNGAIALGTFGGGRIHVEWDPAAAVTPLGQLPFFIEFLKVSGVFEAWVADCPLAYQSTHASDKRALLATLLLSILAGHHRYAHITAIRYDGIHPELLGVSRLVEEREGPHQNVVPLHRVGRGRSRMGRGRRYAAAVRLEPDPARHRTAPSTHRRDAAHREGRRSGAARLH
ncbi:MAG: hypothetical protein P0119_01480 [Nitrospira sp.]|nr:hypothetical protein [Nitrospira sp.]